MKLRNSLTAFGAALAMSASIGVGWATGVETSTAPPPVLGTGTGAGSAVDQNLPELGSPANAVVSLEEEYEVGLGWFRQTEQSGAVL